MAYIGTGQPDLAVADLAQAIAIGSDLPQCYYVRGRAHFENRDYVRAILDYSESIRLDGKNAKAFLERARAHGAVGEQAQASADRAAAERLQQADRGNGAA